MSRCLLSVKHERRNQVKRMDIVDADEGKPKLRIDLKYECKDICYSSESFSLSTMEVGVLINSLAEWLVRTKEEEIEREFRVFGSSESEELFQKC